MSAAEIAAALGGSRREGAGWRCRCPAHDDDDPSLAITERDGKTLLVCRAGCDQKAVIDALRQRDLWPALSERKESRIVTAYSYRDDAGALRYQVVRLRDPKDFRQRRPNGAHDAFEWNMNGVAPLPYRLPDLLADPDAMVFIVEGEKDCDNLAEIGVIATTNHGGAGKWRAEISRWLAGRHVVILPDNDDAGRSHAQDVAQKLAGVAASIRVLELPGLPSKGDVSDWLAAGGTADTLERLAAQIEPSASPAVENPTIWVDDDEWRECELPTRPWVAPGYALRGAVTLLVGPPSAMKSSLMVAWGCSVALGQSHGDFRPLSPGRCLIYNVEDDKLEQRRRLSAVLRQFDASPADIKGKVVRAGPTGVGTLFTKNHDTGAILYTPAMSELRQLIEVHRPDVVIADPLAELHTADENDNTALRSVLAAFRSLAAEFGVAVILLHHTRKGAIAAGDPDTARGASAAIGAARIVLTLVTMPEEDAEALGIPTSRKSRSRYVRLDDAKQNYAGIGDAQWYEKDLTNLGNGEVVAAALPWTPPDMWQALAGGIANLILDDIELGLNDGQRRYSNDGPATDRAAWPVVQKHAPSLTEKQAREVIKTWLRSGALFRKEYVDPADSKKRQGLFVNNTKRPGAGSP